MVPMCCDVSRSHPALTPVFSKITVAWAAGTQAQKATSSGKTRDQAMSCNCPAGGVVVAAAAGNPAPRARLAQRGRPGPGRQRGDLVLAEGPIVERELVD